MTAVPRPASTVVLMDEDSRVYMTKRPKTMKFFGGYYVFPGGAVDKADYIEDSEFLIYRDEEKSCPQGYYVAAARELFEEVGILLCETADGATAVLDEETALAYRRQLIKGELTFLHMLKNEGFRFQAKRLTPFGHLVTPEISPIRFDTRFFLARLPKGQVPNPDEHEVGEAYWLSPVEALKAFQSGKISLAQPTILALKTLKDYLEGSPLAMPKLEGEELFHYKLELKSE